MGRGEGGRERKSEGWRGWGVMQVHTHSGCGDSLSLCGSSGSWESSDSAF